MSPSNSNFCTWELSKRLYKHKDTFKQQGPKRHCHACPAATRTVCLYPKRFLFREQLPPCLFEPCASPTLKDLGDRNMKTLPGLRKATEGTSPNQESSKNKQVLNTLTSFTSHTFSNIKPSIQRAPTSCQWINSSKWENN